MTTPMMQQWHSVKNEHGDGLLFFRMGDFYEFFHDDAKTAARLLGLTLTSRSKGEGAIPMAGIPVRTLNGYINRLVKMGEKVVICDQVEDPAEASGLVERQVTRIVTPGTVTEDEALDDCDNNYLVAVRRGRESGTLAWVDVSTGDFAVREVAADRLVNELARLEPAECLVAEKELDEGSLGPELKRVIDAVVTARPDWCFDHDTACRELNRHFGTRSLAGFGVDEEELHLGAAGAALDYLNETQRGAVGQVRRLRHETDGREMALDRATRASLELVRTLRDGTRKGSLLDVMDRTVTAMGARRLKAWVVAPRLDVAGIRHRQDAVAELHEAPEVASALRDDLGRVLDLERLAARVGCGRASPRDLVALAQSISVLPAVRRTLAPVSAGMIRELLDALPDLAELHALLERALADEPPLAVLEGGIIRDGFHADLDELRNLRRQGKDFIASFQAREIEATGIPNLKIGYNRVFGYYIEVTNLHRDKVPETYLRKQTLKNAERYITPELKEYEDKVLNAEERSKKLEHELFGELRAAAEDRLDDLQEAGRVLATLDVVQSLARLALEDGYVRPEVGDDDELLIEEGRHPVLVRMASDEPFVPNDVQLDGGRRVMLITGPNMAGKSTYIRQVALITLMAQMGSFVPARRARLGVVDQVFTRVGASDDLARGSSTFMVEMLEVANILNNATRRSLVILDEVGRGTSTYDGLSLAWAITEHLAEGPGIKTLFATHYHELTDLAADRPGVVNYNVAVREWGEEIVFLHKIVEGATDKSYGIHVARLAGLPREVIQRARAILERLETQHALPSPASGAEVQLSLFESPPDPLRTRLAELAVEELTPLQAIALLDELRGEARS